MISFAVQKLLSLIQCGFLIFAFVSFVLGERSKEMLVYFMSRSVLSMSPLGVLQFQVLHWVFTTLKFVFLIYMWENVLISLFYKHVSSFPTITNWRDCLFITIYSCLFCHGLIDHQLSSFQSLSCVWLFATTGATVYQASLPVHHQLPEFT